MGESVGLERWSTSSDFSGLGHPQLAGSPAETGPIQFSSDQNQDAGPKHATLTG